MNNRIFFEPSGNAVLLETVAVHRHITCDPIEKFITLTQTEQKLKSWVFMDYILDAGLITRLNVLRENLAYAELLEPFHCKYLKA